ncbi:TPA: hypothetical protein DCX15_05700, partial [bacterium]|nr:hypothetical protein [bacterium]
MTKKEIKEFLSNFVKSKEWRKIREALLWKLDSPYWLIDDEGSFVYTVKQNRRYCQLIKDTEKGAKWCQAHFKGVLEEVKKTKGPFVTKCFANFLGFITPMVVEDEIIGAIGDCQIVDSELPFPIYKEITNKLGIDYNEFIASINEREAIPRKLLEIELGLIHLLCQSSINTVSMELEIHSQKILSQNIVRFYRLLEESRALMVGVDGVKLYDLIINIASESICAEIVSLMIIDPKTRVLTIQAQKGLSEGVVANTQQKIGEGVAGYVALTGSPLLVKDITKDSRFKRKEVYHTRYYTGSLISCPIKIKGEVIGVLNMNNERSARAFTEEDLNLLCIIAEHAALALEAQRVYQVERRREWLKSKTLQEQQTELKIQTEKLKLETERLRKELGKQALWKEEAAKLQVEAKKIEELQREAEWLREEAKKAKDVAEAEKLKAAATELTIQAEDSAMFKETELLKRQMEIYKNQIENLRTQEKDLSNKIKEAQELLLQAEEVKGLREETHLLQKQLNLMKEEEKKLKLQIQEIETYRDRAQEAE